MQTNKCYLKHGLLEGDTPEACDVCALVVGYIPSRRKSQRNGLLALKGRLDDSIKVMAFRSRIAQIAESQSIKAICEFSR